MKHREVIDSFLEWLEGRLDENARKSIDRHLKECRDCRVYFQAMSAVLRRPDLSRLPRLRPDPFLPARAVPAVTEQQREEKVPMKTGRKTHQVPSGWILRGSHPADYQAGVSPAVAHSGQASGYIKSRTTRPRGFGTLMQTYKADQYRGKRLRMSAYVRSERVSKWAGFWMRVDGPRGNVLSFDNMQSRPIKGKCDWNKHAIVLDVPKESAAIAFGVLLAGQGHVWVDDFEFEVVGPEVPTTGGPLPAYPEHPRNLGFEE